MRIRRKRRPHVRRPGMKGDWVVGADFNCTEDVPVDQPCETEVFEAPFSLSLIDSQDLLEKEDSCTVVRVVGDIPLSCGVWASDLTVGGNNFGITIREGIFVASGDGTLPSAVSIILDPRMPGDIELDSWLWLRTRMFKFHILNTTGTSIAADFWQSGADYAVGQNDHIDIRVKRRLKRGQELVYVAGGFHEVWNGSVGAQQLFARMQAHLRCYVKF